MMILLGRGGGDTFLYTKIDNYHYKFINNFYFLGYNYSYYNTGFLALFKTVSGIKKYILAPTNIKYSKPIKTTFNYENIVNSVGNSVPIG